MLSKKRLRFKKYSLRVNLVNLCIAALIYFGLVLVKDSFADFLLIDMSRTFFSLFLPAMFITGISMLLSYYALSAYDKIKQSQHISQG